MLASRELPPIFRPLPFPHPAPVATFFNVPRRYVKSNMQVGDGSSASPADDTRPSRNLRKSSRINDSRSAPTPSPIERTKKEDLSASPRSTKKRLPSLEVADGDDTDEARSPADDGTPQSTTSVGSTECSNHVCLCLPEPKIPRPRNAFILYRQHHQQAIIARNPGLNNPDISKIIGEQWKALSDEHKRVWQDLAQEEKVRHHEQYPDYRYQPRRIYKPGSSPLNPSGQHTGADKYRCGRCGGRSIKTPTTPFLDSAGTPTLPPPNCSEGMTPTTRYLPMMTSLTLDSPIRRRGHVPAHLSNNQASGALREDGAVYSPLTPNKKRRFDYGPPPTTNGRRPEGSYYSQFANRRESLPPLQVQYSPPNSATMPPPRTPRDGQRPSIVGPGPPPPEASPKTVEEVLNAFPYPNKIKLLGRITPPYKAPGPATSSHTRGAIIAIEGDDLVAVGELSQWLNSYLTRQDEYHSRITEPPKIPDEGKPVTFEDYLDLIKEWHGKSQEMIQYITGQGAAQEEVSISPHSTASSTGKDSVTGEASTDRKDSATLPDSLAAPAVSTRRPVVILPTFQLQASVAFASRIPIRDAYSATDHWQWMATLWRGTVGPDLTLYVKTYDGKDGFAGAKPDMDDAVRCLTIFRARGGSFVEADLRRAGFEVNEWIQGMKSG